MCCWSGRGNLWDVCTHELRRSVRGLIVRRRKGVDGYPEAREGFTEVRELRRVWGSASKSVK